MEAIDTLVAEVFTNLVDTSQAPDDQTLEVELVGDSKVEGPVEGVVLGEERTGRCPTVQRLKGRRLHFQEIFTVQKITKL